MECALVYRNGILLIFFSFVRGKARMCSK